MQGPEAEEEAAAAEDQFGAPKGAAGQWASCVRVVDAATMATSCLLELDNNEGATCAALVAFNTPGQEGAYLAVGTAQGLTVNPRQADGAPVLILLRSLPLLSASVDLRLPVLCGSNLWL